MRIFSFLLSLTLLLSCNNATDKKSDSTENTQYVTSLSLSSNGEYLVSAHSKNKIILWDLRRHKKKIISDQGNIFSPYFIKNSDNFIWQDNTNTVLVQNISVEIIKSFPHIPTYGHVITTDLQHYYYSDAGWGLYGGYGDTTITLKSSDKGSFLGHGKLLNLELNNNNNYLLSTGYVYDWERSGQSENQRRHADKLSYEGIVIWDITSNNLTTKIPGNAAKTFATFSPDGKYVVSGDENYHKIVWDISKNKQRHWLADLTYGRVLNHEAPINRWEWEKHGLIPKPNDMGSDALISIKFVSPEYFLTFFYSNHYSALYHIDNDMPIKYFDLGDDPFPSVKEYYRNVSIDTAPEAGILVTGQHRGSGINVYKFDKDKLTLEKIWVTQ